MIYSVKKTCCIMLALAISAAAALAQAAQSIPYQGHLTDAGGIDLEATVPVEVRLYDSLIAGIGQGVTNSHVIYAENHAAVSVANGVFRIGIGDGTPLDAKWTGLPADELAGKEGAYLELWIDGERLSPRQRLGAMPAVIESQYAKYADTLTSIPQITAEMMPAYDASKITSGQFASSQLPLLPTSAFTKGTLNPNTIPALDASKFYVGNGAPKLSPAMVAHSIAADKIAGDALLPDRLPLQLLRDEDLAVGVGTLAHHQMVAIPPDFVKDDCRMSVSVASFPGTAEDGLSMLNVELDDDAVLTCTYDGNDTEPKECSANFLYICKKSNQ